MFGDEASKFYGRVLEGCGCLIGNATSHKHIFRGREVGVNLLDLGAVLGRGPRDEASGMIKIQLQSLDELQVQISAIEFRIAAVLQPSSEVRLLRTVPGIGEILAPLVWLEIGDIDRFPRAENLASYAGLVPRIIASGGRIRHGGTCRNVNHYLKWGFVEAATCAVRIKAYRSSHIGTLYHRLAPAKGHGRAIVAVARHLAKACFWVLRKQQAYKAPKLSLPSVPISHSRTINLTATLPDYDPQR